MAKVGRNDPCHCGSGKKYKKCCLKKESAAAPTTPSAALKEANVNARLMAQKWMSALGGEPTSASGEHELKLIRDEFKLADGNAAQRVTALGKKSDNGVLFYEGKQWIGEADFSEEGKMLLTTADSRMANKLKGKLEKITGVSHVGRTEEIMEGGGGRRASAGAEMLAFKINFFKSWLDEPNERLGGSTPRVAVADPARKKELLKLLAELEKAESKLPKKERYSFKGVRKELGLD